MRNCEERLITRHGTGNLYAERKSSTTQLWKSDQDYIHDGDCCSANRENQRFQMSRHFNGGRGIKRRLGAVRLIGRTFIFKSSVRTVNERSRPTPIPADTYFYPHNPQQCGASVHQADSPRPWWDFFFLGRLRPWGSSLLRRENDVFDCSTGWNGNKRMKEEMKEFGRWGNTSHATDYIMVLDVDGLYVPS